MKIRLHISIIFLLAFSIYNLGYANLNHNPPKKGFVPSFTKSTKPNHSLANVAPTLTAVGDQAYCPLTSANIATNITITDPDDSSTDAIYIQISSGYAKGEDLLSLNNALSHNTIMSSWNSNEGKLTLKSPTGIPVSYTDFENAIKDVQFNSSSATPSGIRKFSISIGQANYLPRNGHYYEYVPATGVSWTKARDAAELKTYYGLKGYLATLTAQDEAQLAGKQSPGTGWIGGSDAQTEGVWKWVTGPEAGTVFWQGLSDGSTPNFAFWNKDEPNQFMEEDYAHITAPGVGIPGSWNDLTIEGDSSGNYQPQGYLVEYGGTPGDPVLHLSANTTLTVASITGTNPGSICDAGSGTLEAVATAGTINWYTSLTATDPIGSGPFFTTPYITATTTYYAANCANNRTPVEAKIIISPESPIANSPVTNCGPGPFTLTATTPGGTVNWYSQINGEVAAIALSFTTPFISGNTIYYAEAVKNNCKSRKKTQVELLIYPLPAVADETLKKCSYDTVILDASITNMAYLWNTAETTQTISIATGGIYTVDVTSSEPENCTARKTITVSEDTIPEITNVKVDETTITIELVKNEDYFEFSIDGTNFQSSNVFTNAPIGLQTAYARDLKRCETDTEPFIVIIVPKYFTPNNDGFNDIWEVKGMVNYPLGEVTIFDRYGKLITQLNANKLSWDGTFNKNPLPVTDYWYILKLDNNSPEIKGHFSLKR